MTIRPRKPDKGGDHHDKHAEATELSYSHLTEDASNQKGLFREHPSPDGPGQFVGDDILYLRTYISNVCMVRQPALSNKDWVLIDTGVFNSGHLIRKTAEQRLASNLPPRAIILTHGHFDHVGAIIELSEQWNVPVYAHKLELPYLTGQSDYPAADPSVGGGLMTLMSPLYPHHGVDLGDQVHPLPEDGSIPFMSEWHWIHTPGHTPGHISLFRKRDRALIVGDAFITVKQESVLAVITQESEIHGPPAYFTTSWEAAWNSVKKLASLRPNLAITGHGLPVSGDELTQGLSTLAGQFDKLAIPRHGRHIQ